MVFISWLHSTNLVLCVQWHLITWRFTHPRRNQEATIPGGVRRVTLKQAWRPYPLAFNSLPPPSAVSVTDLDRGYHLDSVPSAVSASPPIPAHTTVAATTEIALLEERHLALGLGLPLFLELFERCLIVMAGGGQSLHRAGEVEVLLALVPRLGHATDRLELAFGHEVQALRVRLGDQPVRVGP